MVAGENGSNLLIGENNTLTGSIAKSNIVNSEGANVAGA